MAVKDIRSDLLPQMAMLPVAISSDTTTAGAILDTADFDGGIVFTPFISAYTDGTYDVLIEEGDAANLSDAVAVADAKLIGTEAGLQMTAVTAAGATLGSIGVFSNLRYLRLSIVSTSTSTGATVGAVAMQAPETGPAEGLSA